MVDLEKRYAGIRLRAWLLVPLFISSLITTYGLSVYVKGGSIGIAALGFILLLLTAAIGSFPLKQKYNH